MIKIAVSSSNGKTVDQHFGKTDTFYIYKLADNGLDFIEKRDVESYCSAENAEKFEIDHDFNTSRFDNVYKVIQDCKVLYTNKIGETPLSNLKSKGIDVQICSCSINSIGQCEGNCSK